MKRGYYIEDVLIRAVRAGVSLEHWYGFWGLGIGTQNWIQSGFRYRLFHDPSRLSISRSYATGLMLEDDSTQRSEEGPL